MVIDELNQNPRKLHPFISLITLIPLLPLCCLLLGQLASMVILNLIYHYPITKNLLSDLTNHPEEYTNSRMAILLYLAITNVFFTFILSSFIWQKFIERSSFSNFFQFKNQNTLQLLGLGIAITFVSNPANSVFIALNKNMTFPSGFETVETAMKTMEASSAALVKYLTDFQSTQELLMGVLVIGILTGIGEELIFRGAIQSKLLHWTRNPHVAIWVAAFIFSFFHFQFYGFLPRMLLAALFGYLYYWSGNLWVPIVAHACNNAFTILALHFTKNMEETKKLVESEEVLPVPAVIFSAIVTAGLLYLFWKNTSPADRELPQEPIR